MGRYFRTNPLELLKTSHFEWAVLLASHEYASEVEEQAIKSKQRGSKVPQLPGS